MLQAGGSFCMKIHKPHTVTLQAQLTFSSYILNFIVLVQFHLLLLSTSDFNGEGLSSTFFMYRNEYNVNEINSLYDYIDS